MTCRRNNKGLRTKTQILLFSLVDKGVGMDEHKNVNDTDCD